MRGAARYLLCVILALLGSLGSLYLGGRSGMLIDEPGVLVAAGDIVAVVGGQPVTEAEIDSYLKERKVALEIVAYLNLNPPAPDNRGGVGSLERVLQQQWPYLTDEERRFYARMLRNWGTLSKNEAFNQIARDRVLYREAVKKGFRVTTREAQRIYEQVQAASRQSMERSGNAGVYERMQEQADGLYRREMGYTIAESHQRDGFQRLARNLSINRLQDQFKKDWGLRHQETRGMEFVAEVENRWQDYVDSLLRQSSIRIVDPDLQVVYDSDLDCSDSIKIPENNNNIQPGINRTRWLIVERSSDSWPK